mmetsp:Transcript_151808/g.268040  ORF Transcript_151808/g.268040 Transcript_151808/m.268040 type:complete len:248 (+) Transcript_151808:182-925(+)
MSTPAGCGSSNTAASSLQKRTRKPLEASPSSSRSCMLMAPAASAICTSKSTPSPVSCSSTCETQEGSGELSALPPTSAFFAAVAGASLSFAGGWALLMVALGDALGSFTTGCGLAETASSCIATDFLARISAASSSVTSQTFGTGSSLRSNKTGPACHALGLLSPVPPEGLGKLASSSALSGFRAVPLDSAAEALAVAGVLFTAGALLLTRSPRHVIFLSFLKSFTSNLLLPSRPRNRGTVSSGMIS